MSAKVAKTDGVSVRVGPVVVGTVRVSPPRLSLSPLQPSHT